MGTLGKVSDRSGFHFNILRRVAEVGSFNFTIERQLFS